MSLRKTNRRARISDLRRSGLCHFWPLFDAGHAVCGCVVAGPGLLAAALGAALAMIVDSSAEIYGDRDAYLIKEVPGGEYVPVTYRTFIRRASLC